MFQVGAGFEFFEPADVDVVTADAVEEERVVELAGHPADIGGSGGNGDNWAELIWADGQPGLLEELTGCRLGRLLAVVDAAAGSVP
jgi:hypothetical protein